MQTTHPISGGESSTAADARASSLLLALSWIQEHLDDFAVRGSADGPFSKTDVAKLKPLSELALTLEVVERCGVRLPFLDDAAAWAWSQTDEGRMITRLLLARPDYLPACALYASLRQLGYRSPRLELVVSVLGKSQMGGVLPLAPWARLALAYNLRKINSSADGELPRDGLYILARPEPWVISGEIAYAITHEIFYLTDFGAHSMEDPLVVDYLRTWLPYWAVTFQEAGDWDVTGELAIASRCIGHEEGTMLRGMIGRQEPEGAVQGPDGAGNFLFLPDDTLDRRRFLERYHTTLVLAMASAMSLRLTAVRAEGASPTLAL